MSYKVLIILTRAFNPNAGGVQRSTYKISSYLREHGCDTHIYSFYKTGHASQNVAELHTPKEDGAHANVKNYNRLKEVINQIKPDIVINQMPYEVRLGRTLKEAKQMSNFLLLGCLRNTLYPVKLNIDKYLKEVVPKPIQPLFKNNLGEKFLLQIHKSRHIKLLKFILDTYDYFVMFGPPNIDELKYFVGNYKLDKLHLIPNSILSVEPEVPAKEKRILWLSRLSYKQKRADLILSLWKKIMHELPDWQFDIVGDGDAYEDLKQQIDAENLPRVKLYGRQTPYEYYKRSPIYIMTSAFEGFPNTLIEAQSFGCVPVVYDNYPVCSWVVKEGKSGILIPPFEVDTMAKAVIALAKDKSLQNQLMQSALENAREFDLKNVGKKWIDFFDRELYSNKNMN